MIELKGDFDFFGGLWLLGIYFIYLFSYFAVGFYPPGFRNLVSCQRMTVNFIMHDSNCTNNENLKSLVHQVKK